jgi:phosphotransferase system HPr (HPr) family protein
MFAGYVSTALFLPLVAAGMHHGLVALYSVQLQELGYVTLYPALAMAGAGQVGTAIALWIKARNVGNRKLCSVISGALPAGFLGIGEPLIYGVTLPLGKPFITAGVGAGFGGALVMAFKVASTTWGPSGLLGVFVMTAGPLGAVKSALIYLAGLVVSYICSFLLTSLTYNKRELILENPETGPALAEAYPSVRHGEMIPLGKTVTAFEYTIRDPVGIHARPAGALAAIARQYDCAVTVHAAGRSCAADNVIALMALGASEGTVLTVRADGPGAEKALAALYQYLEENL